MRRPFAVGVPALAMGVLSGVLLAAEPIALTVPALDVVQHISRAVPLAEGQAKQPTWQLNEIGRPEVSVLAQVCPVVAADGTPAAGKWRVLATIPTGTVSETPRRFTLEAIKQPVKDAFRFEDVDEKSVKLFEGGTPLFVYNHGQITKDSVPEKDTRRTRGCYVHPVWGLNGEVLTDDFPKDHYHHHGIFWSWPHIAIEGKHYDLWVYNNIQQRFIRWLYKSAGPAAAVLAVENGWYVGDKQVMTERIWLHAYPSQAAERSLDLTMVFIPADKPVTLRGSEGKSYGGLTVRFDVAPRRDASVRVTGRSTKATGGGLASNEDLADKPLPWADLASQFPGAPHRSGGAVFIPPDHPDYPPTWLTRTYGPLCIGWPGVNGRTFEPGQPFTLRYRFWMHKTELETDAIERVYQAYCKAERR